MSISPNEYDEELFAKIPVDVIRMIFKFMDIPSLGLLSLTSKPVSAARISCLASDDTTWLHIVRQRFNLGSSFRLGPLRPKSYGGTNWKAAYRSMALCNRMPRTRFASKSKVIFAKGGGGRGSTASNLPFDGVSFIKPRTKSDADFVSLWVMLGHTCNCSVRSTQEGTEAFGNNDAGGSKFVELHLGMQNVRSGFGTVDLDVSTASVEMVGVYGGIHGSLTNEILRGGLRKPKVLHRSIGSTTLFAEYRRRNSSMSRSDEDGRSTCNGFSYSSERDGNYLSKPYGLTLKPLEFVVVSVHVPCPNDMTNETDFLTRALRVHVPARLRTKSERISAAENFIDDPIQSDVNCGEIKKASETHEEGQSALAYAAAVTLTSLACASFISEQDVWKHYTELPGGCLTLTDRSRLVAV
uniref:F-box domain-containing protein n=1 Tax=Odontella aurita TaxID=265563 RepID=A0A7S4IK14_9STRA|mmetsp:Transcript_26199/g.77509  ORF Transcript_26199/g.77509 Transcript_26199/m.77509 type:complete len:411 (+) Transcript_26199:272-1504(+)